VARRLGRLGERVFGPAEQPGGPGAGVQLWWELCGSAGPVVAASAVLEVLEPPILGRRYAWGLQAGVVDAVGRRVGEVVDAVVRTSGGEWERSSTDAGELGPRWSLSLAAAPLGVGLVDLAVWMDLAEPPDDPPVVARWSSLSCRLASGSSVAVGRVQVTFPQGSTWRRLDVVVDEIGVLQVSNTARTAANMSVLALPPDR
jgi:hypothetical protein